VSSSSVLPTNFLFLYFFTFSEVWDFKLKIKQKEMLNSKA
jgi:hypothetical protein